MKFLKLLLKPSLPLPLHLLKRHQSLRGSPIQKLLLILDPSLFLLLLPLQTQNGSSIENVSPIEHHRLLTIIWQTFIDFEVGLSQGYEAMLRIIRDRIKTGKALSCKVKAA
jgi:hypothetical protein